MEARTIIGGGVGDWVGLSITSRFTLPLQVKNEFKPRFNDGLTK